MNAALLIVVTLELSSVMLVNEVQYAKHPSSSVVMFVELKFTLGNELQL